MRKRNQLGRVAMWALILAGGYFSYRKAKAARLAIKPVASPPFG